MHQRKFQIERVLLNIIVQIKLRQAHFCLCVIAFDFLHLTLLFISFVHLFLTNIIILNCVFCLVLHLHTNCSISLWGNALHYPIPPHTDKQASQQIQRHIYTNANKHKDTRTCRNRRHKKRNLYKRKYTHLHKHKSTQTHQDTETQEHVNVITQKQIHSTQSYPLHSRLL